MQLNTHTHTHQNVYHISTTYPELYVQYLSQHNSKTLNTQKSTDDEPRNPSTLLGQIFKRPSTVTRFNFILML